MNLDQVIEDQKAELLESMASKRLIKRECCDSYQSKTTSKLIKVVTGIRRSGKSVFLFQLLKNRDFAYLNFDDDRLGRVDPDDILTAFYKRYGKKLKTIFFDEIQNLHDWELFVNRLQRLGFDLFVTGSNAKLLSTELSTHLTGRHYTMEMFPFSFREYLLSKEVEMDTVTSKNKSLIMHELGRYITEGGFPEIVVEKEDYKLYHGALYRQIVDSDILIRKKPAYLATFKELSFVLINNSASTITFNKLKKQFAVKSEHTIKNYVSYLNEAYLIFTVNRFSFKAVEIEKSPKKIYAIDTGLINSIAAKHSSNSGRLYETITAVELKRRQALNIDLEVYYYKNYQNYEVDFVCRERGTFTSLIQVCFRTDHTDTKNRETRALLYASRDLTCDRLIVITENHESTETVAWYGMEGVIDYIPLWKWLVGNPR